MVQFIKTSNVFLHQILRQWADALAIKKVLVKMINLHALRFEKYNISDGDLTQQILA